MVEGLRIAVDITHPAHFHFFKNAIVEWQSRGHNVLLLSRNKDLTVQLLDEFGWQHICLSKAREGKLGLALELVEHSLGVLRAIKSHRSQVIAAIGGTFIVYPALLCRIPSLLFYDTENAKLSNRIAYPVATRVITPRAYRDDVGQRQLRYRGYHELSYLHPKRFSPDPTKLAAEGLKPGDPFIFIRLVSWKSHHDVGDYGVRNLQQVIQRLEPYGRILISSESPLPDDLKHYERRGLAGNIHHVLAYAKLFFGESATMASEAAMLGVPGIFLSTSSRGYTDEQENLYQMISNFNGEYAIQEEALNRAEALLCDVNTHEIFHARHKRMLADLIDVTDFIVETVQDYAYSGLKGLRQTSITTEDSAELTGG